MCHYGLAAILGCGYIVNLYITADAAEIVVVDRNFKLYICASIS